MSEIIIQIVYLRTRKYLRKTADTFLWDVEIKMNFLIKIRRQDLVIINEKERIWVLVNFSLPLQTVVKLKGSEKHCQ